MNASEPSGDLIDTKRAAAMLGLAEGTLANWRSAGRGPRWQLVGVRSVRYDPADVVAFREACAVTNAADSA